MRKEFKKMSYLSVGVLISIGLFACGGGGSTESTTDMGGDSTAGGEDSVSGGTGGGTGSGTGGCVNFPRPLVGQKVKFELKDDSGAVVTTSERTITAVSNTSVTQEFGITVAGISVASTLVETFTIANNFRDITRETITSFGLTTVTDYQPFQRIFVDEVCEGQTLNSTFVETSPDGSIQHSKNLTIQAVNVPRTTEAGTFNTFRVLTEETDVVGTSWIDIATGVTVFLEFGNINAPSESGTRELVEIN